MPRPVRTDTATAALPAEWHGPGGTLRPARYTAWIFGTALTVGACGTVTAIGPSGLVGNLILGALIGPVVALVVTPRVFARIDYYMPFRGAVQTALAELAAAKKTLKVKVRRHRLDPRKVHRL